MKRKDIENLLFGSVLGISAGYLLHGIYRVRKHQAAVYEALESYEDDIDPSIAKLVHINELHRRMLYDTGQPDPEGILTALLPDYVPAATDTAEIEREASNQRIGNIAPIAGLLQLQAKHWAATAVHVSAQGEDLSDEDRLYRYNQFFAAAFGALIGSYASLVDWGVVHIHREFSHQQQEGF